MNGYGVEHTHEGDKMVFAYPLLTTQAHSCAAVRRQFFNIALITLLTFAANIRPCEADVPPKASIDHAKIVVVPELLDGFARFTLTDAAERKAKLQMIVDRAADGDPAGQYQLGRSYLAAGLYYETDAKAWLSKAANKGYSDATKALAGIQLREDSTKRGYAKFYELLLSAGNQKNADAQFILGTIHEIGFKDIADNDPVLYAKTAHVLSELLLTKIDGKVLLLLNEQKKFPIRIRPPPHEAYEWYEKSSDNGSSVASFVVGLQRFEFGGVERITECFVYFRLVLKSHDPNLIGFTALFLNYYKAFCVDSGQKELLIATTEKARKLLKHETDDLSAGLLRSLQEFEP